MAEVRREDAMIKVPAMLHLSRMGYRPLFREEMNRDLASNLLPGILQAAMARINGVDRTVEAFPRLMSELRERLNIPDLGESFYRILRDGWEGLRVLDFEHPERNVFHMVPELRCGTGKHFFQPDITLFVNGLPLAMIEVKNREPGKGVRAEYDRMQIRFRDPEFRPFLQGTQLWAISNDHENDEGRFLPVDGVCYATFSPGHFPLHAFQEEHPHFRGGQLKPGDPETERRILAENRMESFSRDPAFRQALNPDSPTHRMLTGLFTPDRFLFLIRYGIHFEPAPLPWDPEGRRRRVLNAEQFFTLLSLREKARRGYRNWRIPVLGTAGGCAMIGAQLSLLRDLYPGARIYRVFAKREELLRMDAALRPYGIICGRCSDPEAGDLILMTPSSDPEEWLRGRAEKNFTGQRILMFPGKAEEDEALKAFLREVRRADSRAVLLTGSQEPSPADRNYTYLLECADGTLYCGWTNDLGRRLQAHNEGHGAKYTRGRRPVRLLYAEEYETREEAMRREWQIKQMSSQQKRKLIQDSEEP